MSLSSPPQSEIDSILELFSNNNLQEALDKIKTLSKKFPDDSLLHNIRGACYAGLGQLGSAVKSYEKMYKIRHCKKDCFQQGKVFAGCQQKRTVGIQFSKL